MSYKLLDAFERIFIGPIPHLSNPPPPYLHRNSVLGDYVAMHLYEDPHGLAGSAKLVDRVRERERVSNAGNPSSASRPTRLRGTSPGWTDRRPRRTTAPVRIPRAYQQRF
ncbi:hypothetical protein L6R50_06640 [Myxococcota bacterium]|nr:hypothetical protein [Myxococcota bacterium]